MPVNDNEPDLIRNGDFSQGGEGWTMKEVASTMIEVTNVSDPRFQIALSRVCPVCGARRGELCGEDEGVHEARAADNDTGEEG